MTDNSKSDAWLPIMLLDANFYLEPKLSKEFSDIPKNG